MTDVRKPLLTPSRNIVSISDLGVRYLFRSDLTSPLLCAWGERGVFFLKKDN